MPMSERPPGGEQMASQDLLEDDDEVDTAVLRLTYNEAQRKLREESRKKLSALKATFAACAHVEGQQQKKASSG